LLSGLLVLSVATGAVAQTSSEVQVDSLGVTIVEKPKVEPILVIEPKLTDQSEMRTPHGALWRSAVAPGWGQIYNKQYIKLPFVYGAIGGLVYSAVTADKDYQLYRRAFQYKAYQERVDAGTISSNPKASYKSSYDQLAAKFGTISSRPLDTQRNIFRRSRDLSIIGVGLVYGLAMLDAFVSAHLLDFDVGENLSFEVTPQLGGVRLKALVPLERRANRGLSNR